MRAYAGLQAGGDNGLTALRKLGVPRAEQISQEEWIQMIEDSDLLVLDRLYDDTLRALEEEHDLSRKFVLVTSRRHADRVHHQIEALGLARFMSDVLVVDGPSGITKAAATRDRGLQAVVGDTEVDSQWALDLDVPFYASYFGFRSERFWRAQNVESYGSLSQIFQILRSQIPMKWREKSWSQTNSTSTN